ncbi:CAP1 [Candida pseudojiufengensis]|uniref:CAP1 n=1 Tax=Candida pseudojiufengensis TaxID=497109 RepID=UPI0022249B76|nr:CAP1 [Candida pseudojiufengensis]KAI5963635.1 CAP1 [Candida pseudojiufengensis]
MSLQLQEIVNSLILSAPSTELPDVIKSLKKILSTDITNSIIENSINEYLTKTSIIIDGYIINADNKDSDSSKFIDYIRNEKFNFDLINQKIIDVESYENELNVPKDLVSKLEQYGNDYYINFNITIIPINEDAYKIILIGEKQNHENFYTGIWTSEYEISSNEVEGKINLDIHYFEDGNVRLKFDEKTTDKLKSNTSSSIVNFINNFENQIENQIISSFVNLNQNSFKNLRRLLPVTRSKLNWGSAIGNYRLGSDVVHKK